MKKTIFNIFILASIAGCINLAFWQLDRMAWKQNLIDQVNKFENQPPEEFALESLDQKNDLYKKVMLFGTYLHDQEILLAAKYFSEAREKNKIGYHVITPFLTTKNIVLFINRGWIPEDLKSPESRPDSQYQVNADTVIEGRIRKNQGQAPWYLPQNMPDKNIWFWIDLPEMKRKLEEKSGRKNIKQVLIQQTNLVTANNFEYPIPVSDKIEFHNQHLMYVITWFSLAVIIFIMWLVYLRKERE